LALVVSVVTSANTRAQTQQSAARTDVYHVHFTKAVPGQAAALADALKTPDPKAPMPNHFILLRHQQGDDWDYCVIQHLGQKATIDPAPTAPAPGRNLSAWHTDTFVSGPPWADFTKAMGIAEGTSSQTANSVYVVAIWRAAAGHRDQLEQALSAVDQSSKVPVSRVLLQHLEGGPWQYLRLERYNSWQDFGADQAASVPLTGSGKDGWSEIRQHSTYHHDTLTDRIAPK
jgi:hypothetical protein